MALFESGGSSGAVSLDALLNSSGISTCNSEFDLSHIIELICRGGWPALLGLSVKDACQGTQDYLEEIRRTDINDVEGSRRDPEKVGRLLRSLARNVATSVSVSTLAADVEGPDGSVDRHTVADYLSALSRLFVVEDQPAWQPHLRSRYALRKAEKRHFVDPSLAVAALRASPSQLRQDLNLLELLFESLVIRDLRVYSQRFAGHVLQYRDSDDLEVDAIVENATGNWGAFEVKLGGSVNIERGAQNLLTFGARVDTTKCGAPKCLAVIVSSGYAYQRPDGVLVVPIGCLGP
jgi:predicted AAA+ superfamily ATPase